jgi:hypothetical protein
MKIAYEFVKDLGWMAAVAILLILGGYSIGAGESLKTIFDLNASSDLSARLGLLLLVIGFALLIGSLLHAEKLTLQARQSGKDLEARLAATESELNRVSEQAREQAAEDQRALKKELGSRREQVKIIADILYQHRAMGGPDDEDYMSRVFNSAQRMRVKTDKIAGDLSFGPTARKLAQRLSVLCSEFLNIEEYVERRSGRNLRSEVSGKEALASDLEEQDRQSYLLALGRWRTQAFILMEGAEIAVKEAD